MLTTEGLRERIASAIAFLQETDEPHALLFMAMMYWKFGVQAFANSLARYDEVAAKHEDAPKLRVLRRVADPNNPLQPDDWDYVTFPKDRILVSAIYCDRIGLPDSYAEVIVNAVNQGGYALTHALLSYIYVLDNGCRLDLPDGFVEKMYTDIVSIIDTDPGMVNDIKLEAAAFLCMARQGSRVDPRFLSRVLAIQNEDGGWGRPDEGAGDPDGSSWHSTILALILLLHVDPGEASPPS